MNLQARATALGLASLILAAGPAAAASATRVVAVLRPAAALGTPVAAPQHRVFGALVGVSGHLLTLQLRNGRLLHVNADAAFALNRVSQPFFRGKPTVVEGNFGAGGLFYASVVRRAAPAASHWGLDR